LDSLVARFEDAWRNDRPVLDEFLPPGVCHIRVLVELAHIDLEYRLKAGETARVEDYLQRYPQLVDEPTLVLELIKTEYRFRRRREPSLSTAEYVTRFPQYQDQLCAWLNGITTPTRFGDWNPSEAKRPPNAAAAVASPQQAATISRPPASKPPQLPPTVSFVAAPDIPEAIGRFRVQGHLGAGGFARVYLAHDPSLDRQVALKVPHETYGGADFIRREATLAAKLKHPGIVSIYEICDRSSSGARPGDPPVYIVMQYVEGRSLAKKLAAEKVSLEFAVDLLVEVAEAVAFAHEQGVLHRDLKPQNILLDHGDRPYVTDFGLAVREETLPRHIGEVCGTLAYMSPEQANGASLTAASDVWSMGVILYELLARQKPFGSHPLEVLHRLGKEDPVPPRHHDSTVSPELERICLKCLAREPANRYQAARDLAADLRKWKSFRSVGPNEEELRKAEQCCKQALTSIDSGEPEVAIERLQTAVRLNPDSASAHYYLGLAYLMTNESVRLAVQPLRRATELNRGNDVANFLLAQVYQELGAFDLAALFAAQALEMRPADARYRELQRKVRDRLGSAPPAADAADRPIAYELEPIQRRRLSDVAASTFHLEQTRRLSLTHWTEFHYPWRLFRHRPLLSSFVAALGLGATVIAVDGLASPHPRPVHWLVLWIINWMGFYVPFLVARLVEKTYVRLLPAINMPEEAFRRFFIRQCAYLLGGTCALKDFDNGDRRHLSWAHNRPQLLIAAVFLLILLILHYTLLNEPAWPRTPDRAAHLFAALAQAYCVVWMFPLALLCSFFLPRFYNVPVRYFLGMPPEASLGALGGFYLRLSALFCPGYLLFLLQHYLFRTYQVDPLLSMMYVVIGASWTVGVVVLTQYQLYRLLGRLKARKVLEYSYHVEASFARVMKDPSASTFEELAGHRRFLTSLRQLSTRGLTSEDFLYFLLLVVYVVGVTFLYGYLVTHNLWLF
jgi:tetratricopeptide (TPR) repeat protein